MTSALSLTPGARYLLANLQQQSKPISLEVEQKISAACEANGESPLTQQQLERLLIDAMPSQSALVSTASQACRAAKYPADSTAGSFITQIIGPHKIEKERADTYQPPPAPTAPTWRFTRDPLSASFVMDQDADTMLLFNARDVDEKGRPLLMKVVSREGHDCGHLDLSKFRTKWEGTPDIVRVPADAAFVEIKDLDEHEFGFGDPLIQVSLCDGKEVSRSVAVDPTNALTRKFYQGKADGSPDLTKPVAGRDQVTSGHQLDETPPMIFDNRLRVAARALPDFPVGGWTNTPGRHFELRLVADRGLIFEPKSLVELQDPFSGTTHQVKVPADDAFLLGSPPSEFPISTANLSQIGQLKGQSLQRRVHSEKTNSDLNAKQIPFTELLFPRANDIQVGADVLKPLSDVPLTRANAAAAKVDAKLVEVGEGDAEIALTLGKGFLTGNNGASICGWKIVPGIQSGQWEQCEPVIVQENVSPEIKVRVPAKSVAGLMASNRPLEIRVFNEHGVPAERVTLSLREMPWIEAHHCPR